MLNKKLLGLTLASTLFLGGHVNIAKAEEMIEPIYDYAPPQGTLVNGVEQVENSIQPYIIDYTNPIFVSYSPTSKPQDVKYFKYIAGVEWDNTRSSSKFPLSITISKSSASGSEFYGDVQFEAGIKAGILGKLKTTVSGGVKETRSTNEAVGLTAGPFDIPAGKYGGIDAYWGGIKTGGTLTVKYVDTGSLTGYTSNRSSIINATVHKNEQKIYGQSWTK